MFKHIICWIHWVDSSCISLWLGKLSWRWMFCNLSTAKCEFLEWPIIFQHLANMSDSEHWAKMKPLITNWKVCIAQSIDGRPHYSIRATILAVLSRTTVCTLVFRTFQESRSFVMISDIATDLWSGKGAYLKDTLFLCEGNGVNVVSCPAAEQVSSSIPSPCFYCVTDWEAISIWVNIFHPLCLDGWKHFQDYIFSKILAQWNSIQ